MEDGNARGHEGAERAGEAGNGRFALHIAKEREFELHAVDPDSTTFGGCHGTPGDKDGHHHGDDVPNVVPHPTGEADDPFGELRQLFLRSEHVFEDGLEAWHDDKHEEDHDARRDAHHDDGVNHRRDNLVFKLLGFFLVFGETVEDEFENTAELTSLHHVHVKLVKDTRILLEALGEGGAGLHVLSERVDGGLHHRNGFLAAEHGEASKKWQAGINECGELAGEDHEHLALHTGIGPDADDFVFALGAFCGAFFDRSGLPGTFCGYLGWIVTTGAELVVGVSLRGGFQIASGLLAILVEGDVMKSGHR